MWRKNDAHKDELEGVAQRLRNERPEASPLELDRIKTTAMSRAKSTKVGSLGARRFAVGALTFGLMAAGTGGVIASTGSSGGGNAAVAQYSSTACDVNNNDGVAGNGGSNNNNEDNRYNCNENSFNETTITNNSTNNSTNTDSGNTGSYNVYNAYSTSTIEAPAATSAGSSGVLASKTVKAAVSKRHFSAHFFAAKGRKLKKLVVKVDGKVVKTLTGSKTTVNLDFVGFPCTVGKQVITLTGTLSNGKKVTETRHYNLCQ